MQFAYAIKAMAELKEEGLLLKKQLKQSLTSCVDKKKNKIIINDIIKNLGILTLNLVSVIVVPCGKKIYKKEN
jgi:hypothetical protein